MKMGQGECFTRTEHGVDPPINYKSRCRGCDFYSFASGTPRRGQLGEVEGQGDLHSLSTPSLRGSERYIIEKEGECAHARETERERGGEGGEREGGGVLLRKDFSATLLCDKSALCVCVCCVCVVCVCTCVCVWCESVCGVCVCVCVRERERERERERGGEANKRKKEAETERDGY